jgi:hypothetical protein
MMFMHDGVATDTLLADSGPAGVLTVYSLLCCSSSNSVDVPLRIPGQLQKLSQLLLLLQWVEPSRGSYQPVKGLLCSFSATAAAALDSC